MYQEWQSTMRCRSTPSACFRHLRIPHILCILYILQLSVFNWQRLELPCFHCVCLDLWLLTLKTELILNLTNYTIAKLAFEKEITFGFVKMCFCAFKEV
jgi:hypothetical protein